MKTSFARLINPLKSLWTKSKNYFSPGKAALFGATLAMFITFSIVVLASGMVFLDALGWGVVLIICISLLAVSFLGAWLLVSLIRLLARIHFWLFVALLFGIPGMMMFFHIKMPSTLMVLAMLALFSAFAGGVLWKFRRRWVDANKTQRGLMIALLLIGLSGITGGLLWLFQPGKAVDMPPNAAMSAENLPETLNVETPALEGPYEVKFLTYGSGEDLRRKEYGQSAQLITEPVDGSAFLDSWTGFGGKMRTRYFGFDAKELPLNARVWYPKGEGPFPLVLIVHGNHLAQNFSDPGYAYLGKLLASRGFILASIDQNFLNGSWADFSSGLSNENDARGWLLLKHLEVWQQWNEQGDNPFSGKVDMENIALIGHSRGGEAAAHAALFNRLPYYPDDFNETLNFHFNIISVIAIAPSDGQFQPSGVRTPLMDVNYLVFQGSHDADVSSYMGLQQLNRVEFSDDFDGFKAGLYIWAANHGQFNTVWGRKDGPSPRINFFNLGQLLPAEEQRTIAEVYITAFLEATLRGKEEYRPMFMDHRKARHWLPETVYINQYEQGGTHFVANFKEDLDLTTPTVEGGNIIATDLSIWKERMLPLQWGNYNAKGVMLGWNTSESDTLQPCYHIQWPAEALKTDARSVLVFSMAETGETADPPGMDEEDQEDEKGDDEHEEQSNGEDEDEGENGDDEVEFVDFTLRLSDVQGQILEFSLSSCMPLQPLLKRQLTKLAFMNTANESESILQFFYFPLQELLPMNPNFNPEAITGLSFIFDKTETGVVAVSNIGFMRL